MDKNQRQRQTGQNTHPLRNRTLITGTNVAYTFGGEPPVQAVRNVRFSIAEGGITAIVGESGSGKSTLLRLIFGLLPTQTGEIRYRGERLPDPREVLIPGHPKMRMVSQAFEDLNTYANVWDNVASQLPNTDLRAKQRRTHKILQRLRILHLKDQRVFDLSGGEKQRVALAAALVSSPEVLLMDEPFNQVDAAFRENLQEDIRDIVARTGVTILMVSHDPAEVLALADQLLVMRKGRLSAGGSPKALYERPPDAYTARLLARANILSVAQARSLGISTDRRIAIHLHAIEPFPAPDNGSYIVQSTWYKGSHNEIVLRRDIDRKFGTGFEGDRDGNFPGDILELRCAVSRVQSFREGDRVDVTITDYWPVR